MVRAYQGGTGGCSEPLVPLPGVEVTRETVQAALLRTREAAQIARTGNVDDAELAFAGYCTVCTLAGVRRELRDEPLFGKVHDLTHNLDGIVRQKDKALAKGLCQDVLAIEVEFWKDRRPDEVARLLDSIAQRLEQALALLPVER